MKLKLMATAAAALFMLASPSYADEAAAKKWIDAEFQPSTLSKANQLKEMDCGFACGFSDNEPCAGYTCR